LELYFHPAHLQQGQATSRLLLLLSADLDRKHQI